MAKRASALERFFTAVDEMTEEVGLSVAQSMINVARGRLKQQRGASPTTAPANAPRPRGRPPKPAPAAETGE